MASTFAIQGTSELRERLRKYTRQPVLLRIIASYFVTEAEKIITEAKQQTPVDLGTLRSSGHVMLPPDVGANTVAVTMGFGGAAGGGGENSEDVGYAVYVHENLQAHHTVGNAKYLERPFDVARPRIIRELGFNVEKDIKKRMKPRGRR